MDYQAHFERNPKICGGRWVIKGTRRDGDEEDSDETIHIVLDHTTDDQPIYIALSPE